MHLMDLGFGEPENSGASDVPWETGKQTSGATNIAPDKPVSLKEDLEIYRKAERFKALRLLSGNSIPDPNVEKYISEHYGKQGMQRYKLAKFIMVSLGYKASPDVLLMLSCTNKARIIIATAGAGKTTSLQFDLLISKLLDKVTGANMLAPEMIEGTTVSVPKILYLNYNKHNVQPIQDRHTALCSAVNKLFTESDAIDDSIESSTVHAFCHKWLKAFSAEIELPDLSIISEDDKSRVWTAIIKPRWTKFYGDAEECGVEYPTLDELYNFKTESMLDWDDFFETAKFVDSGLKADFVKACIKKYDTMKRQMKLMDFTDYLILMIQVLKDHPEYKRKLQERYRIIVADENQDFTRLMNELLIQLYSPEVNQLIVVGDPDQTIYAFKGVSPDNVVSLSESLEDVQLLGLDTNYRCPDKIVDAAKAILNLNVLRFEKPINTVRTGGLICTHPLSQGDSQEIAVLSLLKRLSRNDYAKTVITYRNNISALTIAEELYYAGIPFKILDDRRPFNNPVFRQITRALRALKEKDNFDLNKELYRFLPVTKEQWTKILEFNRDYRRNHLHDLQVPNDLPRGSMDALRTLIQISVQIDTAPVCDFITALVKLYRTYYFDFIIKQSNSIVQDNENFCLYLDRALKFYNRQMTLDYMMMELRERNVDSEAGITLSTFHGLKGLEFDYVIAIDFCESLFPNYFGIEQRYSKNTAMEEKESENRLCYVLVTRAIKEFHMFYTATDPSAYVGILTQSDQHNDQGPKEELTLGSVIGSSTEDSRMSFVQRLLGNRG